MNRVLRLGFHTSVSVCRFAVPRWKQAIGSFVHLRSRAMESKRRVISSSPTTVAAIVDGNKERKFMVVEGADLNSRTSVVKDINVTGNGEDIQGIQCDPQKIETMTIQELRTSLRRIGIPAKGRKQDLVSALRSYVENNAIGGSSEMEKEDILSSVRSKSISIKGVADSEGNSVEDSVSVSEGSYLENRNKRFRQSAVEKTISKVSAEVVTTKQKLSTKNRPKKGKNVSPSKKEVSLTISSEVVKADGDISLSLSLSEPWTVLAHKKPQKGWIPYNPRTMRPPPLTEGTKHVKLMTWNVNGLRALLKLEGFSALQLAQREDFDVLCLQETKLQVKDVEAIKQTLIDGYDHSFWSCSVSKLGYSGTAIVSRIKPLSVRYGMGISDSDHDIEGRTVTVEFDSFYLTSAYVPNSGDGLKRLPYRMEEWDPSLSNYLKELEKSKPVILTGDLNCAHEEIDIYNPAGNRRSAGFTDEERQSFGANFLAKGFVDTFRKQHPGVVGYTYWGYRHGARKTNKGWRLDYFLVSGSIADKVHDSYILPDVNGSDHCPLGLVLKL